MRELALFAGAGGGLLGSQMLGWKTVCAVEIEPYPASVLMQRQNDGLLEAFPVWDDVCTFDGKPWRGIVDVVSGGFPCQDISAAGKGAGIEGERSGLWSEFARIISEVRPRYAFVENSPMLTTRGLDRVLCDLASMGFDARWGVVSAAYVGAPHKRERIWVVAHANSSGKSDGSKHEQRLANTAVEGLEGVKRTKHERAGARLTYGSKNAADTASQRSQRPGKLIEPLHTAEISERQTDKSVDEREHGVWEPEPSVGRENDGLA